MSNSELVDLCSRVSGLMDAGSSCPEATFATVALDVFRFQFARNRVYQRFCESMGKRPDSVMIWSDIPAMVTSAFKEWEVTTLEQAARVAVFHSSGTTAQRPSRHFHSMETLRVYERSLATWFGPHVLPDCPKANFLILSPPSASVPHSSLAHMFEQVSGIWGDRVMFAGATAPDGSWTLDLVRLEAAVASLSRSNLPIVICGTAFSFVHWADYLGERAPIPRLPAGSRIFETGGYKGRSRTVPKAELHRMLQLKLGIPDTHIISEYGMSELSSQAYDRTVGHREDRVFHFPPWTRAVLVAPETLRPVPDGETGLVRVYDLANVGSVMAVQTEDLARRRGNGFELMGRAALAEPRGCSLLEVSS